MYHSMSSIKYAHCLWYAFYLCETAITPYRFIVHECDAFIGFVLLKQSYDSYAYVNPGHGVNVSETVR